MSNRGHGARTSPFLVSCFTEAKDDSFFWVNKPVIFHCRGSSNKGTSVLISPLLKPDKQTKACFSLFCCMIFRATLLHVLQFGALISAGAWRVYCSKNNIQTILTFTGSKTKAQQGYLISLRLLLEAGEGLGSLDPRVHLHRMMQHWPETSELGLVPEQESWKAYYRVQCCANVGLLFLVLE